MRLPTILIRYNPPDQKISCPFVDTILNHQTPMTKKSLQTIILELQEFWAEHGYLYSQLQYTQVGAGNMNPATLLRVLDPESWNVAYVEPSVHPDDGRYGENPNRFQHHTQFQVIMKPDPANPVPFKWGSDPQQFYLDLLMSPVLP